MTKLAQIDLAPPDGFKGVGTLGLEGADASSAGEIFNSILSTIVGLMTIVAFIWFVFLFLSGALGVMTAGGDKAKVEGSKQKLMNGIIGLVIVIAAIFIIDIIGGLLGIENILNPAELIENISL